MTISIRQAFKNVASEKYNKKNLIALFIIVSVSALTNCMGSGNPSAFLLSVLLLISIACSILSTGIYQAALYNAIRDVDGVFSDFLSDFNNILKVGVKGFLGCMLSMMALLIPTMFIMLLAVLILKKFLIIAVLIEIASGIAIMLLGFGVFFNFIQSLNFKDWFDYKKSFLFIKKAGLSTLIWFIKFLAFIALFVIVIFIAFIILGIIFGLSGISTSKGIPVNPICMIMCGLVIGAFSTILTPYIVDLTSQYIKEVNAK